jgi:hypothetical protein
MCNFEKYVELKCNRIANKSCFELDLQEASSEINTC